MASNHRPKIPEHMRLATIDDFHKYGVRTPREYWRISAAMTLVWEWFDDRTDKHYLNLNIQYDGIYVRREPGVVVDAKIRES